MVILFVMNTGLHSVMSKDIQLLHLQLMQFKAHSQTVAKCQFCEENCIMDPLRFPFLFPQAEHITYNLPEMQILKH